MLQAILATGAPYLVNQVRASPPCTTFSLCLSCRSYCSMGARQVRREAGKARKAVAKQQISCAVLCVYACQGDTCRDVCRAHLCVTCNRAASSAVRDISRYISSILMSSLCH